MLRYIYLLCFIITINLELVFCYNNYIISENARRSERQRRGGRVSRPSRQRQGLGFEDRPLQQLDAADFMLSPDEAEGYQGLEAEDVYSNRKSYQPQEKREWRREAPYPADLTDAEPFPGALSNYQQKQLLSQHLVHNKKKKSALTKVFPFFSHNKSSNAQQKKGKSKVSGKSSKNAKAPADSANLDFHTAQKTPAQNVNELHLKKRYAEQICPKCKMKFLKLKKRWQPNILHNSRQYFANNAVKQIETSSKQFKNNNVKQRLDVDVSSELWRKKRRALRN